MVVQQTEAYGNLVWQFCNRRKARIKIMNVEGRKKIAKNPFGIYVLASSTVRLSNRVLVAIDAVKGVIKW
jgi:hypothetical protein